MLLISLDMDVMFYLKCSIRVKSREIIEQLKVTWKKAINLVELIPQIVCILLKFNYT